MSAAPIIHALPLMRDSVLAALVAQFGAERAFWQLAPIGTIRALQAGDINSVVVFQSQDRGGRQDEFVNQADWVGLVAVRSLGLSAAAAEANISGIYTAMSSLGSTGYIVTALFQQPIDIPVSRDGIHTTGLLYEVRIEREVG